MQGMPGVETSSHPAAYKFAGRRPTENTVIEVGGRASAETASS